MNWRNLYDCSPSDSWFKGNIHTHTKLSKCGHLSAEYLIDHYTRTAFDFISLTDHNIVHDCTKYDPDITLLPGVEIDYAGKYHMGILHHDIQQVVVDLNASQQEFINSSRKRGCIVILNHPDFQIDEHYPIETLNGYLNFTGIEIYNGVVERADGSALSTAKWDRLLSRGKRILGFATQDAHRTVDLKDLGIMVKARSKKAEDLFHAMVNGCFYCYYGVTIRDLGRNGNRIWVHTENSELIRFVGYGGRILKEEKGRESDISFTDEESSNYIRIECMGKGKEISFSQPFSRDGELNESNHGN
jgi:hypothetical protein